MLQAGIETRLTLRQLDILSHSHQQPQPKHICIIFLLFAFTQKQLPSAQFIEELFISRVAIGNSFARVLKVLLILPVVMKHIRGAFNKFPDFFEQAFKIDVDSWKFSILLLYILWDDWPIFMISASNEQLQQQLEYTLLKPDCHS